MGKNIPSIRAAPLYRSVGHKSTTQSTNSPIDMNINRLLIAALSIAAIAPAGWSQSFDDDIYYDASKAKKKETVAKKVRTTEPASFPAADTYAGELTSSTRDIDEYNRRGIFAVPDSVQADSLAKHLMRRATPLPTPDE